MPLPTQQQLQQIKADTQAKNAKAIVDKLCADREKAHAEMVALGERISGRAATLISQIPDIIEKATAELKNEAAIEIMVIRPTRGQHTWDEETTAVADKVIDFYKDEVLYKFTKVIINIGYNDSRPTADGGMGDEFWVDRTVPGIQITWST